MDGSAAVKIDMATFARKINMGEDSLSLVAVTSRH